MEAHSDSILENGTGKFDLEEKGIGVADDV
jgi:hypothetical protein